MKLRIGVASQITIALGSEGQDHDADCGVAWMT